MTTPAPSAATAASPDRDGAAVADLLGTIARGADLHQWALVRAAFADAVVLDYGTPERLSPAEIVGRWQPLLEAFDSTQHHLTDVAPTVDGDRATATARFRATHRLRGAAGGDVWVLAGRYEYALERTRGGWRVTAMRMIPEESSGNAALLEAARAKATASVASPAGASGHGAALAPGRNAVRFPSEGDTLVGTLFLPASYAAGATLPLVVVTGSWTTVKEQMADLYARRLADRGYAALTFDFRGFGESQGSPRQYESPDRKAVDVRNAVAFARTLPVADPGRVGGLAVCASAGYMARAIADGAPLASFVTVAAWLHDPSTVGAVYGGADGVAQRVSLGRAAREQFERTGAVDYVAAYDPDGNGAAMFFPVDYYGRADRGAVPQWTNQFAVMSWSEWLTYDALAAAPSVSAPTLMIHSDDSAYPDNVRRFHAALGGAKDLLWTQGAHIDFYDRAPYVDTAVDAAADHFARTLGAPPAAGAPARARNREAVEAFFRALEAKDIPAFLDVWADDGVQVMPYAPAGFPQRLEGKDAIGRQYGGLPANYTFMRFPREVFAMEDPERFVVRYRGEIGLKAGGRYDNTYVGLFTVRDGLVREFVEFFDPIVLERAFGGALTDNFNVRP